MANGYRSANPNLWLGQPATGPGVVPGSAGLRLDLPMLLHAAWLQNRAAGAAGCALVGFLPDASWQFGQWDEATTTVTDDTADAQDEDTNDCALELIGAPGANDGFCLGCDHRFGAISLDITTAGVGAAQEHTCSYWNGTAWTLMPATAFLKDIPRTAGQLWAAGEALVLFDPPVAWQKGGTGTGVNPNRYNLLVKASVVPTTAALARRLYLGEVIVSVDQLGANGEFSRYYNPPGRALSTRFQAIGAAFGTADGSNTFEILY
jgi:hypothetical protein